MPRRKEVVSDRFDTLDLPVARSHDRVRGGERPRYASTTREQAIAVAVCAVENLK
jgi:hypothetical protein